MSSLPLGINQIKIQRSLTTSNVAVFVPFVTQELFQSGAAMYYGINAKSHNMIMLDRKQARCPNGLKLGTPGSGKSMSCKSEIVSVFLTTADDIFISDPEAEYYPLVKRLHGQVIKLSPTSKDYVNPLDINLNYSEDDSPLALKSDFVLSFCELVMGGKTGLEAIERTVIDRAVKAIYRPYLASPCPENMPILSDLHQALLDQHLPEADRVAQALDLYVSGSLNVFNHKTNVDIHNRLVAFDIKELGKQLKKLGMLIIQDQIWGRVTQNRSQGRATWYFADEFHFAERRTDRRVQCRDLEALPQMGRCAHGRHPECEGPSFFPGDREHSGKQRLHHAAESGIRRPQNPFGTAEPLRRPAEVHRQFGTGRRTADF